jgi:hypothetical protein
VGKKKKNLSGNEKNSSEIVDRRTTSRARERASERAPHLTRSIAVPSARLVTSTMPWLLSSSGWREVGACCVRARGRGLVFIAPPASSPYARGLQKGKPILGGLPPFATAYMAECPPLHPRSADVDACDCGVKSYRKLDARSRGSHGGAGCASARLAQALPASANKGSHMVLEADSENRM